MKKTALLSLLTITAATFMTGCDIWPMGGGQEISGWPLEIGGTYKSQIYTGDIEFPGTTTFTANDGKLSGEYELTASGEKVTGTLSDFKTVNDNTLKCRWKDKDGVGNFTIKFAKDMSSFRGKWENDENDAAGNWNGKK